MDEQVELLRGIWNEMKALNGRVDTTNERLVSVERGLDSVRDEMHTGFRGLSERIDAVHERSVRGDLRIATSLATLTSEVREMKELSWSGTMSTAPTARTSPSASTGSKGTSESRAARGGGGPRFRPPTWFS